MPGEPELIALSIRELGGALSDIGGIMTRASVPIAAALEQICKMKVCLDTIGEYSLPPQGRRRLAQALAWQDSPRRSADALKDFQVLKELFERRGAEGVEAFKKQYARRLRRQRAAVDRIRRRKKG